MLKYSTYLISLVVLLCSTSCESVLDTTTEVENPQLVFHSLYAPDSLWKVHLSHTTSLFDAEKDVIVDDATLSIWDLTSNHQIEFTYSPEEQYYVTNQKPVSGHVYYASVNHPDYGQIQATSTVPSIDQLEVKQDIQSNGIDAYLNLEIIPKSQAEKGLYYAWEVVEIDDKSVGNILTEEDDNEINSVVEFRDFNNEGLFFVGGRDSDSGTIKDSLNSNLIREYLNQPDGGASNNKKIAVKLIAISDDMYKFYNTLNLINTQNQTSQTTLVELHNNISGGHGIFAAYKEKYIILD